MHAVLKRYNVHSIADLEARLLHLGKEGVDALGHELHVVRSRLQQYMQDNWRGFQAVTGLLDVRYVMNRDAFRSSTHTPVHICIMKRCMWEYIPTRQHMLYEYDVCDMNMCPLVNMCCYMDMFIY